MFEKPKTFLNTIEAIIQILKIFTYYVLMKIFVLLSLHRYLCRWTINPRWYHPHSSHCFGTDMVY